MLSSFCFASSRSFSISVLRLTTMFLRGSSILRISARIVLPMYSLTSPGRRTSICEAGRNAGTPMSTRMPPLILRTPTPSTISPSEYVSKTFSQLRIRSAFRLESLTIPFSSSKSSRMTSISTPDSSVSQSSNSLL